MISWTVILEHLVLVFAATAGTLIIGLPLGITAYMIKPLSKSILWFSDILQTIPALALLGLIMIIIGGNAWTVIIGLILYSLLPVIRNTYVGLSNIEPSIKEAATGMGMTRIYRLIHIELPLAFPVIFTGIRIAVVTSIGTAVFGTFVGGGGLGTVIYRSIHVQNMNLLLQSTLALMIMAVIFDFSMSYIEKKLYSK